MSKKREIIVFGHGDLGVATGGEKGQLSNELIIYKLQERILPLGKKLKGDIGKSTDELDTIARWRFEDAKSVQVVIDMLKVIKKRVA